MYCTIVHIRDGNRSGSVSGSVTDPGKTHRSGSVTDPIKFFKQILAYKFNINLYKIVQFFEKFLKFFKILKIF